MQNDRPDEAERQLGIAIHNVVGADVDQFDLFKENLSNKIPKTTATTIYPSLSQKLEGSLHVLDEVDTHLSLFASLNV